MLTGVFLLFHPLPDLAKMEQAGTLEGRLSQAEQALIGDDVYVPTASTSRKSRSHFADNAPPPETLREVFVLDCRDHDGRIK